LREFEENFKSAQKTYSGLVHVFWKKAIGKMENGEPKTFTFVSEMRDPDGDCMCEVQGQIIGEVAWIPFGHQGAKLTSNFSADGKR